MKHVSPLFTLRWSHFTALGNHAASRVPSRAEVVSRRGPRQMRRTINHFERIWAVVTCAECSSMVTCSFFFHTVQRRLLFHLMDISEYRPALLVGVLCFRIGCFSLCFHRSILSPFVEQLRVVSVSPFLIIRRLDWCQTFCMRAMGVGLGFFK